MPNGIGQPGDIVRSTVEGLVRSVAAQGESLGDHVGDSTDNTIRFFSELIAIPFDLIMLAISWVPSVSTEIAKTASMFGTMASPT